MWALLVALRGIFREFFLINFADMPCAGCECVAEGGRMQGCCVGARIGVRSQGCMERVPVSTKSTKVGYAARQCRCRRREPILAGGSPPQWSWTVAVVWCCDTWVCWAPPSQIPTPFALLGLFCTFPPFTLQLFLDFRAERPLNLFVSTIHQVIYPWWGYWDSARILELKLSKSRFHGPISRLRW